MKVLMIAPQPFFQPRGTPISVYQRLQGLSSLGHEVDLLTYHIGEDVNLPGVTIKRTPAIPGIQNIKIGPSWPKLLLDTILFGHAIVMLLRNRYDALHSHEEAAFFAVILAILFRTPHIYDMHSVLSRQLINFDFFTYGPILKLFELLEKWVIHKSDGVITIGSDLAAYVSEVNPGARQTLIENLPIKSNGNGRAQYSSGNELKAKLGLDNRVSIVYTGTFERYQGLDLLFDSMRMIKERHPEASLVMVGGKPHQVEFWQNETRKSGLADSILFTGTVAPEETLGYLELADILVSPRVEGLSVPLKIYTYLHSGKPIVATKIVAHTQILTDDIAVLVEPTQGMLANGILNLIQNPVLRQQLGLQAQKFAQERYNTENYLSKLRTVYEKLPSPPLRTKEWFASSGTGCR